MVNYLELESLHLIDISSEDDSLIPSPDQHSSGTSIDSDNQNKNEYFELFEVGNAKEGENAAHFLWQREQKRASSKSSEPGKRNKIDKHNLPKSPALDSAFFTGAGVLNPEELSTINKGIKSAEIQPLHGIQEDFKRSTKSISTMNDDSLTQESLGVDLCEDTRASIEKSSKAYNATRLGSKRRKEPASRTLEPASQNMIKPMAASKKQSISKAGSEKITKEAIQPQAAQTNLASRSGKMDSSSLKPIKTNHASKSGKMESSSLKPIKTNTASKSGKMESSSLKPIKTNTASKSGKMDSPSLKPTQTNPASQSGKMGSSLKPIKMLGKANPIATAPTKVTSSGAKQVKTKSNTAKAASGRRENAMVSKKPALGGSCSVTPRSILSPISTSSVSSCATEREPTDGITLDSTGKSPLNLLRNKTYSKNVSPASSGSVVKTSTKKLSSSVSPASSNGGRSIKSSSPASTVNQRSNSSKASLAISSTLKGVSSGSNAPRASNSQGVGLKSLKTGLVNRASSGTAAPSLCTDGSKSVKSSGLRMPSPKIGSLDAKSAARTPNGGSLGAGINKRNGETIKTKASKLQASGTVAGTKDIKSDSPRNIALPNASSRKPSASPKPSGTAKTMKNSSPISSKVSK